MTKLEHMGFDVEISEELSPGSIEALITWAADLREDGYVSGHEDGESIGRDDGYDEGYDRGYEVGLEEGREEDEEK